MLSKVSVCKRELVFLSAAKMFKKLKYFNLICEKCYLGGNNIFHEVIAMATEEHVVNLI